MIMRTFFGSAAILASIFLSALPSIAQVGARDLLTDDVKRAVRTIDKSVRMYHYFVMVEKTDNSDLPLDAWFMDSRNRKSFISDLIKGRAAAFWDMTITNPFKMNAGAGMYLALDPNSTKEYGYDRPMMAVIDFQAGLKYLSTTSPIKLRPETIAKLIEEHIVTKDQLVQNKALTKMALSQGITADTLRNMILPENAQFRLLMQDVLESAEVTLIEYGYKSHLAGFCKLGRKTSFVFTGSRKGSGEGSASVDISLQVKDHFMANEQLVDLFSSEPAENDVISNTIRLKKTLAQIQATAFVLDPKTKEKVIDRKKVRAIIPIYLSSDEALNLQNKTFRCDPPT
jgi:hypothetical protein